MPLQQINACICVWFFSHLNFPLLAFLQIILYTVDTWMLQVVWILRIICDCSCEKNNIVALIYGSMHDTAVLETSDTANHLIFWVICVKCQCQMSKMHVFSLLVKPVHYMDGQQFSYTVVSLYKPFSIYVCCLLCRLHLPRGTII